MLLIITKLILPNLALSEGGTHLDKNVCTQGKRQPWHKPMATLQKTTALQSK